LAKLSQGKTVYTAYFEGAEIRTPLEMVAPAPEPTATPTPAIEPEPAVTAAPEPTLEPTAEPSATAEPTSEPTPEPTATPTAAPTITESGNNPNTALYVIIALLSLLVAGGAFYIIKNGKGKTKHEKTVYTSADAYDDSDDGDDDFGG
jgi:outer membrane biosynthesis protein TonB